LLGRNACTQCIWHAYCMVCLSVCLSECWSHECALQKFLNWSKCHLGGWLSGPKKPCIRWDRDPLWAEAIFGEFSGTSKVL